LGFLPAMAVAAACASSEQKLLATLRASRTYGVVSKDLDHWMARRLGAEDRFECLYAEHGRALLAYALRRTSDAQDAADVVADVCIVAERRRSPAEWSSQG
jgi:hypothetical protein